MLKLDVYLASMDLHIRLDVARPARPGRAPRKDSDFAHGLSGPHVGDVRRSA